MDAPFIVYAMPRSRSYWLSRYLSFGDWRAGHDELKSMRSLDDVRSWFNQPCIGSVETAAAPWWRLAPSIHPGLRTVILRRPVAEVLASFDKLHVVADRSLLERNLYRIEYKLSQIEKRVPNVLSTSFAELQTEAGCARVFEFCLPYKHDAERWLRFSAVNMQIDMIGMLRYIKAHEPQLTKLAKTAKHESVASMTKPIKPDDGMTYQLEDFETFLRDGVHLFNEHATLVGEAPDAFSLRNLDLGRALNRAGRMHLMTARSNGRMFGYLMTLLSPSPDVPGELWATATTTFASPDAPGVGWKLHRATVASLRRRPEVRQFAMRAGVRGDGPRLGVFARRLGAQPAGELYTLSLGG